MGATGNQGGAVVRSLVQNKSFKVRGITRYPSSKASQDLVALGVEVVKADGWKEEEITAAFAGSWAAFVNTNSDDPRFMDAEGPTEFELGKSIIDGIIKTATVKHLIYSSAVSTSGYSGGVVKAKTTEMKSEIERYAVNTGYFETFCPVYAGFYMELFASKDMARVFGGFPFFPDENGVTTLCTPRWGTEKDMPAGWISVNEDFGDIVHGVLTEPEKYHKKGVEALSDACSFPDVASCFQSVTGKKTQYVCHPSCETYGAEIEREHPAGLTSLEDTRSLFRFGQLSNAKYFGDLPTDTAVPARLKARAFEAMGKDPKEAKLFTLKQWFENNFQIHK
ncbi:hypothetical protein ACN38_g6804 [Penicillium nordicum]|uniref:NmrA-like domain-containing protein n=1 Tax=Penicillium nordicum TaxID=229535 RepID=A0A0N0RYT2_9EURO|nr:hypothetical protein ACN38_g6804 [Penicillium nordicum]